MDEPARRLARRAAELLASAGRRAVTRSDAPAAVTLLERSLALRPPDDPDRPELEAECGRQLAYVGELARADEVLGDAIRNATDAGARSVELRARIERANLHTLTDPEGATEALRELAESALPVFERLGDEAGLARAWAALAWVHKQAGSSRAAMAAAERAIGHALRAGDPRTASLIAMMTSADFLFGHVSVEEGIRRCEEFLVDPADRPVEAAYSITLGGLLGMRGDFEPARSLIDRGRSIFVELGVMIGQGYADEVETIVELLAGDAAAAERAARHSCADLERRGEKSLLSTAVAELAEALLAQGRYTEAERLSERSEELGASDDVATQSLWRRVRAKVLARRHETEQAIRLAREAVEIMPRDQLNFAADARMDLADVLALGGNREEAARAVGEALTLYEEKGNIASAQRARERLAALSGQPSS